MSYGNIFIISAPSGAGKSSLIKALCIHDTQIIVSISHTTRAIRPGETDGQDYYFITQEKFSQMLQQQQFLEHAKVYGNFYGTHINTIQEIINTGHNIILEIDYQGACQVKKIFPESTSIFILPPNKEILTQRLIMRNTDSPTAIQKRLSLSSDDIAHAHEFDYIVINNNFDSSLQDLYSIIMVQRFKANKILADYKF